MLSLFIPALFLTGDSAKRRPGVPGKLRHWNIGEGTVIFSAAKAIGCIPSPRTVELGGFARPQPAEPWLDKLHLRSDFRWHREQRVPHMDRTLLPVRVNQPRRLPGWSLPAERVALGKGYKPSLAQMPDGSLVMVAVYIHWAIPEGGVPDSTRPDPWWTWDESLPPGRKRFWAGLWRSADGGRSWSDRQMVDGVYGHEPFLSVTSDGVLFATTHLLDTDIMNDSGQTESYLHRSIDGANTWTRQRVALDGDERCGVPEDVGSHASRNVAEGPDGTLFYGVCVRSGKVAYLWTSSDCGETWDTGERVTILGSYNNPHDGFFCEDFTYLNGSGALLHWVRIGPSDYGKHASRCQGMYPLGDCRVIPTSNDSADRTGWTRSVDGGRTWAPIRDFGDYGQMYPRVTRLRDGRLILTYTQRGLEYPLGLRAVLSHDDGDTWDFAHDQIVIDGSTPWGADQGGGFGNTIQLEDGTLISCYSWNPGNNRYEVEVVRWRLP